MKNLLTIGEFARYSGISRYTLIFYDKKDLLKPLKREENDYRLYGIEQLQIAYVITSLRKLDMPLEEIKNFLNNRTPELAVDTFSTQLDLIDQKIENLLQQRYSLQQYQNKLLEYHTSNLDTFDFVTLEEEPLLFNEESSNQLVTLSDYFTQQLEKHHSYQNHVGKLYDATQLFLYKSYVPKHFYVHTNTGTNQRPAGNYLRYITHSNGHDLPPIYQKIHNYIDTHHLDIGTNVYEDFLIDEVSEKRTSNFVVRILVEMK